jgi:CDP-diacylglycerol--glycerol-3-phosphate 3-phosphatidyltransferase
MKKHIANIITGSRIVFSLSLLFIPLSSEWFYALYLLCGLSDMIDGTVARRTNSASEFGARLDTVSDFVFMSVALIKFLPHLHIPIWLWIWNGIIAMIKLGNAAWGFVRTKKLISPHTLLNKLTGLLLFFLPVTISVVDPAYTLPIVCTIATVAAIHEVYDTYSEKKHDT